MDNEGLIKAEEDVSLPPSYSEGDQNCKAGYTLVTSYGQPVTTTDEQNNTQETSQEQPYTLQPYGEQFGQTTETAIFVSQPGQTVAAAVDAPPNHYLLAWMTFFCCFLPLGMAAIIKSREVDLAMIYGDRNRAVKASVEAKNYSILSIFLGILIALAIAMYHLI